jgi:hypothetical protein
MADSQEGVCYGDHLRMWYLQENNCSHYGTNCQADYTNRMDFIVVRCSVTNNDLPSIYRFDFQCNAVKANRL